MSKIKIVKPSDEQIKRLELPKWDRWECEPSEFEWAYADEETAYVFEGKVLVKTENEEVEIGKGDLVTFPKGLKCHWTVLETVKKVYKFNK